MNEIAKSYAVGMIHANGEIGPNGESVRAHLEQMVRKTDEKMAKSLARLSVLPARKVDPTYRGSRRWKKTPMECVCEMVLQMTVLHAWDPCHVLLVLEA